MYLLEIVDPDIVIEHEANLTLPEGVAPEVDGMISWIKDEPTSI